VHHQGRVLTPTAYLRFEQPPQCIVVAGDNAEPALLRQACEGAQVLVHEATYTQAVARGKEHHGHSSAAAVARFAASAGLPNLVLTHFSPRYQVTGRPGLTLEALRTEAAAHYNGALLLAADYDRYRLDKAGELQRIACEASSL